MVMSCFLAALGHEQPCGSLLSQSIQLEYDWPDENCALIPVSFSVRFGKVLNVQDCSI
jgi:hypothetical protein